MAIRQDPATGDWYDDTTGEPADPPPPPPGPGPGGGTQVPGGPNTEGTGYTPYTGAFTDWSGRSWVILGGGMLMSSTGQIAGNFSQFSDSQWSSMASRLGLDWNAIKELGGQQVAQVQLYIYAKNGGAGQLQASMAAPGAAVNPVVASNWLAGADPWAQKQSYYKDPNAPAPWTRPDTENRQTLADFHFGDVALAGLDAYGWNSADAQEAQRLLEQYLGATNSNDLMLAKSRLDTLALRWQNANNALLAKQRLDEQQRTNQGMTGEQAWAASGYALNRWEALSNLTGLDAIAYQDAMRTITNRANATGAEVYGALKILDQLLAIRNPTPPPGGSTTLPRGYRPTTYEEWGIDPDRIPPEWRSTYQGYLDVLSNTNSTNDQVNAAMQELSAAATRWSVQVDPDGGDPNNPPPNGPPGSGGPDIAAILAALQESMNAALSGIGDQIAGAMGQGNEPTSAPPPDPMDTDILQAMRATRQAVIARQGYRSTFVSGPRGIGGPTTAEWGAQLNQTPNDLSQLNEPGAQDSPPPAPPPATPETSPATQPMEIGERDPRGYVPLNPSPQPIPTTGGTDTTDDPLSLPDTQGYNPRRRQYW